jgi:hypothetical protein
MDRDGERAEQLMCEHLRKGLEFRTRLITTGSRYGMPRDERNAKEEVAVGVE